MITIRLDESLADEFKFYLNKTNKDITQRKVSITSIAREAIQKFVNKAKQKYSK